jgi:SPP1 gp7 family putative phage head morphogenesis protein
MRGLKMLLQNNQTIPVGSLNLYQRQNYDPTRTTTLRNNFSKAIVKRLNKLASKIQNKILVEKFFDNIQANTGEFAFTTSAQKLTEFQNWLEVQIKNGILETRVIENNTLGWANTFITDTYKRGIQRARYEMKKAGYDVPTIGATGGVEVSFGLPMNITNVELLYSRVYSELKGITDDMSKQISIVLSQGMADGDNPRVIARKLNAVIKGGGADLGIYDTLGRFIPARRRAQIMARTEIVRAHHTAMVSEYSQWSEVLEYEIQAELFTAGDNRVCSICNGMAGNTYTLDEARNLIPIHPQCRCILLPKPKR